MSNRNGNDWYEQQNRSSGTRSRRSTSSRRPPTYRSSSYRSSSYRSSGGSRGSGRPSGRGNQRRPSGIVIAGWRFSARAILIFSCLILVLGILILSKIVKKPAPQEASTSEPVSEETSKEPSETSPGSSSLLKKIFSVFPASQEEQTPEEETPAEEEEEAPIVLPDDDSYKGMTSVNNDSPGLNQYFVYGTHFFFTGTMETLPQVTTIELVLRPAHLNIDLGVWKMLWTTDGETTTFTSAETITEGPNLETLPVGEYAWLVKLTSDSGDVQYRTLRDDTGNAAIEYYTITKNGKNNRVMLDTLYDPVHDISYFGSTVEEAELPENVYDFTIDPGHGGNDGGTNRDEYTEREFVLEASLKAYDMLTEMGYKVWLTRDGTESPDRWMWRDMYEEEGRVTTAGNSNAKYMISVHINAAENTAVSGYQLYGTCRGNMEFAKVLAACINEDTDRGPSPSTNLMVEPGVYYNTYSGYMYDGLFNNTDGYYIIRDTGGIGTSASSGDGSFGINPHQYDIKAPECVLAELGYLSNDEEFEYLKHNMKDYGVAIAHAFDTMAKNASLLNPADAESASENKSSESKDTEDQQEDYGEGGGTEGYEDTEDTESSAEPEDPEEEESYETSLPDDVVPVE